eukprot:7925176-Prorocentrum_lima.AAC.1
MCIRDRRKTRRLFLDDRQQERVEDCKEGGRGGAPLLEAIFRHKEEGGGPELNDHALVPTSEQTD